MARTRDVAGAEDALSDAFAAALVDWPANGVPETPEAWLLTVARRKWIDATRRRRSAEDAGGHLQLMAEEIEAAAAVESSAADERLSLMFACAHPAIDPGIRAPLILQTILGFDAAAIGSAFLISPATMSQRLVRAKRKIRDAGIPFQVPEGAELAARIDSVLEAIYAAFAEGWSDPTGTEVRRRNLAEEGIWLGRLVVSLLPGEPEALGLLSLMLHAQARRDARRDSRGEYVPFADQDPGAWDIPLIEEAEGLLARASAMPVTGRYQLEAAVQSAHVVRRQTGRSDWAAIESIYDALFAMTGSPVVAINRAIAVAETRGPAAGLEALSALSDDPRLAEYQPYWAARAGLLARTGESEAADAAFERAIGLERDPAVRRFLERRRAELSGLNDRLEERMEKVFEIYIRTTPQRLWEAITDPEIRSKYNFGARVISDWTPGSRFEMSARDGTQVLGEGENLEVDPPRRLVQTMLAFWSDEVKSEGTSRVTWEIEPIGDSCRLTVTHDQLREGANNQLYGGWPMILSGLKTWLETGKLLTTPGSLMYATDEGAG